MKIKYVGLKTDGETAFASEVGIAKWMPGDSVEITNPAVVSRMLKHPDVFAEDTIKATKQPAIPVSAVIGAGTDAAGAALTLTGMDDAAVRSYAKEQGLKVAAVGLLKGDNLRAKVTATLAQK